MKTYKQTSAPTIPCGAPGRRRWQPWLLVISRMSNIRAGVRRRGSSREFADPANELWQQISNQDAIFLVTRLRRAGSWLRWAEAWASSLKHDVPAVRDAAASFPKQTSGFVTLDGHLYQIAVTPVYVQAGAGMGLLNVLVAGYEVNAETVRSLKDSTGGSDFCFISGDIGGRSHTGPGHKRERAGLSSPAGTVARIEAGGTHYTVLGTPLMDI